VAGAAILAACRAKPAPATGGPAPIAVDRAVVPAAADASPAEAGAEVGAGHAPFSADRWLREHGIATWSHDAACWSKLSAPPAPDNWFNECACERELALATPARVDLMVCTRFRDGPDGRMSPMQYSVVYAVVGGRLRVVLDVPTEAAIDGEAFGLYASPSNPSPKAPVGNVSLSVGAEGTDLVIVDNGPARPGIASCPDALADAEREKLADVRRVYGKVCASIGRWQWTSDRLVRQATKK